MTTVTQSKPPANARLLARLGLLERIAATEARPSPRDRLEAALGRELVTRLLESPRHERPQSKR
jgi:hypothetical protein